MATAKTEAVSTFSRNLRWEHARTGLSNAEVAVMVGTSPTNFQRWLDGDCESPHQRFLASLANHFGYSNPLSILDERHIQNRHNQPPRVIERQEQLQNHIPNNLRWELSRRHQSQADLAHALGLSTNAVSSWMNSKTEPSHDSLMAIAEHFGYDDPLSLRREDHRERRLQQERSHGGGQPQPTSPTKPTTDAQSPAFDPSLVQLMAALQADLRSTPESNLALARTLLEGPLRTHTSIVLNWLSLIGR